VAVSGRDVTDAEAPIPGKGARDPVDVLDSPTAGARVIRGSLLRLAGYVAGVLLGIVSASLLTRHLGVEDFGKYIVVSSLITIIAGLTDAGLATIAVREFSTRKGEDRDRLLANVLGIRLAVATLGAVAATGFTLVAGYEGVMVIGTLVAGIGLVLTTAQQTLAVPLGVTLRLGWISAIDLLRQAFFVALVVLLVFADAGLLAFLAATVPVSLLVLVPAAILVRGTAPLLPQFDRAEWLRVLRLTGAYAAAAAVGTLYVSAVVVVTSLVGTETETGNLGAAFRVFSILGAIPILLVSSAFPIFARAARSDLERLEYALKRVFEIALIVGSWMALATVFGARFAIDVVAGDDYEPAVPVLQIEGGVLAASFVAIAAAFALVSLHRHRVLLLGNALALMTAVVLTVLLVPEYGAKGAAVATLVAELELAVLYLIVLFRPGAFELDFGIAAKVAIATASSAALILTPLEDVPLVVAATIVYWAVLWLVRGIPAEIRQALGPSRSRPAA
jgi:O-antigen/teichoic acid export membrane protein